MHARKGASCQFRERQRSEKPNQHTKPDYGKSIPQDHRDHFSPPCTQRHVDPDLARPLAYALHPHAIQTDADMSSVSNANTDSSRLVCLEGLAGHGQIPRRHPSTPGKWLFGRKVHLGPDHSGRFAALFPQGPPDLCPSSAAPLLHRSSPPAWIAASPNHGDSVLREDSRPVSANSRP